MRWMLRKVKGKTIRFEARSHTPPWNEWKSAKMLELKNYEKRPPPAFWLDIDNHHDGKQLLWSYAWRGFSTWQGAPRLKSSQTQNLSIPLFETVNSYAYAHGTLHTCEAVWKDTSCSVPTECAGHRIERFQETPERCRERGEAHWGILARCFCFSRATSAFHFM